MAMRGNGQPKIIAHLYLNERDCLEWQKAINEELEKIKNM